jgi:hypothetical protein
VIIALTGRAGVGKTTVALNLCERHAFTRIPFAGPLKAMLHCLYVAMDLRRDEIEARITGGLKDTPDYWLGGASPRRAMQTLGTEWGRHCLGENFWTGVWQRSVTMSGAQRVVTDDCRFHNEADMVRSLGGVVIGLQREVGSPLGAATRAHLSEYGTEPDEWVDCIDDMPAATAARVFAVARSIRVHRPRL